MHLSFRHFGLKLSINFDFAVINDDVDIIMVLFPKFWTSKLLNLLNFQYMPHDKRLFGDN